MFSGKTFETEYNQGCKQYRAWAKLRDLSDQICYEHQLSVIEEPKNKGMSHFEWDAKKGGISWKEKLRQIIAGIACQSKDLNDFFKRCTENGIEYVYKPNNKVKLKFRLKGQGQQRFTRADTLGADYTPERLAEQIEQIQKSRAVMNRFAELKTVEKPEPIETPTIITAEEFINGGEKVNSITNNEITEEEFFALLSKPTESKSTATEKPPEKKNNDGWASIRGMGNSARIIAELESVGIHSVGEFKYFNMQASKDISGISEKLAALKKQIGSIDMLISKLKQRAELSATYKEYQGLSGLRQKHFKKKNTDAIDSYEQADKYVKEHIKACKVDGKTPTVAELKERSQAMKNEHDGLLRERKVLEKKHAVTSQYNRTVRNYINQQTNKRAAEQSRQRRLSQQKKKNTLE